MDTSALVAGRTYFRLTFADADLTMPGVQPLVFLGEAADDSGDRGFVFQDTVSYVRFGSGLEGDEQHEEICLYFMSDEDARSLADIRQLASEVAEAARRAESLDFPTLSILRAGWQSAT